VSKTFEVRPTTKMYIYGLTLSSTAILGRVVDPPILSMQPASGGMPGMVASASSHLLHSTLAPAYLGPPLDAGTMLTVQGSLRAPGGTSTPLTGTLSTGIVGEMRQKISGLDASGAPIWTDAGFAASSSFSVAVPANASGSYLLQLTLTDALGNSGTVTATITR
jgi:hypothetical protein